MVHGQWWIAELQVGVGGWGSVISRSSPVVATHVTGIFPPPSATGDGQNRENHPSKFRYLINFTHSTFVSSSFETNSVFVVSNSSSEA